MCVIIVKPAGRNLPSYETLKACSYCNPHGFGFATSRGIYKSMDFETFYDFLISNVKKSDACIIHFRYATHGSRCKRNCHPFAHGDLFFAHNGILNVEPIGDLTDSETAFREYIVPVYDKYGLDSKNFNQTVYKLLGASKFAFLKGNRIKTYGAFASRDGLLYSNLRHEYIFQYM